MILAQSKTYCENLLITTKCSQLPFHNLLHTQQVVQNALLIAKHLGLSKEEIELILIAAWFHDTGFYETYYGHEEVSIGLAQKFLKKKQYPPERIDLVLSCIEATKMPQNPKNQYAEVLSDADILHISTPEFFYRKLLLRKEWELELGTITSDLEWHKLNLHFLQNHTFFTKYGKSVLMKGKIENEVKVNNLIKWYSQ